MKYKPPSELCSNLCGRKRRKGQRTCRACHAADMKLRRAAHKLAMEQLTRACEAAGILPKTTPPDEEHPSGAPAKRAA